MHNSNSEYSEKINDLFDLIQTIFKSNTETTKTKLQKLNLSNSKRYLEIQQQMNLMFIFENSFNKKNKVINRDISNLSPQQINYLNLKISGREEIDKFSDNEVNMDNDKDRLSAKLGKVKPILLLMLIIYKGNKLRYSQIHLNILRSTNLTPLYKEVAKINEDYNNPFSLCDTQDINLSSFLANINFIDHSKVIFY